jgi:arylsulfatase A
MKQKNYMPDMFTKPIFALILAFCLNTDASTKPNIVFVLADDLGWAELGCYGNTFNETPNLDRMAKEGMRFTQAYAAAPVCSPYRAALLTGQHPARLGILDYLRPNSANRLPTELITLPEKLKQHGYRTGMIGKWHLTGYRHHEAEFETRPTDHGFDWNFGSEVKGVGNGANTWPYVFRTQPIRWLDIPENRLGEKENLTDRLNLEAVDFIERNQKNPFFLYLAHYAPHTILNGRPDLVAKYREKHAPGTSGRKNCYICEDAGLGKGDPGNHWAIDHNPHLAAMLEGLDDGIGKIRAKLAQLDLLENTIFIFTSDNGGESNITSNTPLRGGKSELYEGGIRVPLIVQWPAKIRGSGVSDEATVNTDFYPTLTAAAGIKPEGTLDGVSILENWKQPTQLVEREAICWHYPLDRPHFLGGFSGGAIRSGDWKLIERFTNGKTELYNLAADPSEESDLSEENTAKSLELEAQLASWRKDISARTPSAPLLTEPRQLHFSDHFSGQASERLWYSGDWSAENGILQRVGSGTENTRIFLRDAAYDEVLIRFDFQLQKSKDIRMLTGSHGHYNSVVHIRPDHFYIQTAKDETGPYFSYRHGECAYDFEPDRWYTMTVEIIGNQMVAHIDGDHVAYATHPILEKDRTYFAFQVDDQPAAFDNVQILSVRKHRDQAANLRHIKSVTNNHPVGKSPEDEYRIRLTNAHEWLYQRHPKYRALIQQVDDFDEQKKKRFPAAFSSHKEFRKTAINLRKKLNQEDSAYKELLHATHRAKRALDTHLIGLKPEFADYPDSRRKAEIERLRRKHGKSEGYRKLVAASEAAQKKLESAYPQAFITDDAINLSRTAESKKLRGNPEYKKLQAERAATYRAQQDYLVNNGPGVAELQKLLDGR